MLYGKDIQYNKGVLYSDNYIELIEKFNCGNPSIDKYLKEKAKEDLILGRGTTKLFLNKQKDRLIGFYTLNCTSLVIGDNTVDGNFNPAVEIKMFAVDREYQKIPYSEDEDDFKLSDDLLLDIIDDIRIFTESCCGASHVVLYSIPYSVKFYTRNGFKNFLSNMKRNTDRYVEGCIPLFLTL